MSNKPNIWELIYNKADKTFLIVIRGHIYIEYLLNKMIDAKKNENDDEVIGFRKKLIFLKNAGVIKDEMKDYLFGLNEIRNKYAHDLKYKPNYEEAHGLARKAQKAGIYFKDDRIFGIGDDAKSIFDRYTIFYTLAFETFQELLLNNQDLFSAEEVNELMISKDKSKIIEL